MSYYTNKILNNYNKAEMDYDYSEEESEMMTDQYESESNEFSDSNRFYGGLDNKQKSILKTEKTSPIGGLAKYLNPGKLISSNNPDTNQFIQGQKRNNPYAKTVSYDPYKNDTYSIDIDLNKIKKDSEVFESNINKQPVNKGGIRKEKEEIAKKKNDVLKKNKESNGDDDASGIYDYDYDNDYDKYKYNYKDKDKDKDAYQNDFELNNEAEIEKILNEKSEISDYRNISDSSHNMNINNFNRKEKNSVGDNPQNAQATLNKGAPKTKAKSHSNSHSGSKINSYNSALQDNENKSNKDKDSTISIDYYMNLNKEEKSKENSAKKTQNDIEEADISYNKLTNSNFNDSKTEINKAQVDSNPSYNKIVSQQKEEIKSANKNNNYDTITSDAENKYNDFISTSKLENQSEIEDDLYNKFEEISSNLRLETSHNNNIQSLSVNRSESKQEIQEEFDSPQSEKVEDKKEFFVNEKTNQKLNSNKQNQIPEIKKKEEDFNSNLNTKNSQDTGIILTNSNNNNVNNKSFDLKFNKEYIQNIIIEEFRKFIGPVNNSNHALLLNNPSYSDLLYKLNVLNAGSVDKSQCIGTAQEKVFHCNPTNLQFAREEIVNRIHTYTIDKCNNFLIDCSPAMKSFDKKELKIKNCNEIILYRATPPKRDIREMKLQLALEEERKEKEFYKMNYYKEKETVEDLELKMKKFKKFEIENSEIKKINLDTETKYNQLEKEFFELKIDYENKIKLVEERVQLRESKSENKKIYEVTRNFEIEVENLKMEVKDKNSEIEELKKKSEYFEDQNTKLSLNKISNLETNEKIKELRNENFILHEKYTELLDKLEKSQMEKDKLQKKIFHLEIFDKKNSNSKSEEITKDEINKNTNSKGKIKKKISSEPERENLFDQILIERELNVQETIIQSYIKEIERLNKEIKLLKNITVTGKSENKFSNKNSFTNNFIKNKQSESEADSFSQVENKFVKESAEAKIKIIKNFLAQNQNQNRNRNDPKEISLSINEIENEFLLSAGKNLSALTPTDLIIDLDSFLTVMKKFKFPLSKYELIEIFNSIPRNGKNKIRLSDFIHVLKSSNPFNFFIQPDPPYLVELETKIIQMEKKISLIEKENSELKKKENEWKEKNYLLLKEFQESEKKIKELSQNCVGMFMTMSSNMNQNVNSLKVNNANANFNQSIPSIPFNYTFSEDEMKKLKEKIKQLEAENSNTKLEMLKQFEKQVFQYEEKFKEIEKKNQTAENSIKQNEKIHSEMNTKLIEVEREKNKMKEKITRYKQNYSLLKMKMEQSEKEKEKFFKILNQNLIRDENINANMIQNFFLNSDQIVSIAEKINSLEAKNKERDEHYRQLCYKANSYQVNKELENLNKKFESEKKELLKIIASKNFELIEIKKEFEEILKELEEIKSNKRITNR